MTGQIDVHPGAIQGMLELEDICDEYQDWEADVTSAFSALSYDETDNGIHGTYNAARDEYTWSINGETGTISGDAYRYFDQDGDGTIQTDEYFAASADLRQDNQLLSTISGLIAETWSKLGEMLSTAAK